MTTPNGLSGLKGRMLTDAEKVVNDLRKRKEFLQNELAEVNEQEEEARELMQLLRTGKVQRSRDGRIQATAKDYYTALETLEEAEAFSIPDVMDLVGATQGAVNQKLRVLTDQGALERVSRGVYKVIDLEKAKP